MADLAENNCETTFSPIESSLVFLPSVQNYRIFSEAGLLKKVGGTAGGAGQDAPAVLSGAALAPGRTVTRPAGCSETPHKHAQKNARLN